MADEKTFTKEFRESLENKRMGSNFLGVLNDIKRRPSDAAKELKISTKEIENIINKNLYPKDKVEELENFRLQGEKLGIRTYMALSPLISPKDDLKRGIDKILNSDFVTLPSCVLINMEE